MMLLKIMRNEDDDNADDDDKNDDSVNGNCDEITMMAMIMMVMTTW